MTEKLCQYYREEGLSYDQQEMLMAQFRHVFKVLMILLDKYNIKEENFVDLACAEGFYVRKMESQSKFAVGLDISRPRLEKAKKRDKRRNTDCIQSDMEFLPFRENSFPVILGAATLEHVLTPQACLKEMWRILSVGGWVILEVPMALLPFRIPPFYNLDPCAKLGDGHLAFFTPKRILNLLDQRGFEIREVFYERSTIRFIVSKTLNFLSKGVYIKKGVFHT